MSEAGARSRNPERLRRILGVMVRPERFELPTYSSGGNLEPLGPRGISALQRAQWAVKRHYWLQLNTFCTRSAVRES